MFESLMHPKKECVGKRIRIVKEELGVSFTELGNRLGVIKSTINSYAQGYTLAPEEVIEQLAKITGKSIGWFYFGTMEEYIRDYLLMKGYDALLVDYPDLPVQLKKEFINSSDLGWDWKNEYGYPYEVSLDDIFYEKYFNIMKKYIINLTQEYIYSNTELETSLQEEVITLISTDIYNWFQELRDFKYGEKETIQEAIKSHYEKRKKENRISFDEEYLIGKMINILADDFQTRDLIISLSQTLTGKGELNMLFGADKVIQVFQTLRPKLIELYTEHSNEEFYEWFDK